MITARKNKVIVANVNIIHEKLTVSTSFLTLSVIIKDIPKQIEQPTAKIFPIV